MARPKVGTSPQTKYRHAREQITNLEAALGKLERSRPRTAGKKGWKTRRIAATRKTLASVRGSLTKAKNAIAARTAAKRTTAKKTKAAAKGKRSEAAKRGHETHRTRAAQTAPSKPSYGTGRFMPFLTEGGLRYVDPVGSDRSLVGSYWHAVGRFLDDGSTASLDRFADRRVWDAETGLHLSFVTDTGIILAYHDEIDFGFSFYKSRNEVARMERFAA